MIDKYISEYEKETGKKATYLKGASTYHTLKFTYWLASRLAKAEEEIGILVNDLDKCADGWDKVSEKLATLEKRIEDAPEGIVAESNGSLAVVRTIELKQGDIKSGTQVKLLEDKDK